MTPIEIIRAVNGKALTVRVALQIIAHQKEMAARRVLEYYKKRNHTITPLSALPPKIAVLSEQIRQELG